MDETEEVAVEIKEAIKKIIESKQNINNAIHKIIETPEWYVDSKIKGDLRTKAVQMNYSIEKTFYKISNEHNEYNEIIMNAFFEYLKENAKKEGE